MESKALTTVLVQETPAFSAIYSAVNPGVPVHVVNALIEQEKDYLRMHMVTKDWIGNCVPETIAQAIKYAITNRLSLDPNAGMVYLMPASIKVGNVWKNILEIKPTADAKIWLAKEAGTIIDNERPTVTKNSAGKVTSAAVNIQLATGRWEVTEIDESDFERMKKASHVKNGRGKSDADLATMNYANKLYTSFNGGIDPEFARSKVISTALKKRGTNMSNARSYTSTPFTQQNGAGVNVEKNNFQQQSEFDKRENGNDQKFDHYEEVKEDPVPAQNGAEAQSAKTGEGIAFPSADSL